MKKNSGEVYIGLIVSIILVAILLGIGSLVAISKRADDSAENNLSEQLKYFVNDAAAKGGFSQNDLDRLQDSLDATNNSYEIEIRIDIADVNPGKKTENQKIGDTTYYSKFNAQVLEDLKNNGVEIMQEGNIITASAKNVNTTIYQMLRNVLYGITGNEAYRQAAQASAICKVTGSYTIEGSVSPNN